MKSQTWVLIAVLFASGPIGANILRKHQKGQLSNTAFIGIYIILLAIVVGIARYVKLGI